MKTKTKTPTQVLQDATCLRRIMDRAAARRAAQAADGHRDFRDDDLSPRTADVRSAHTATAICNDGAVSYV